MNSIPQPNLEQLEAGRNELYTERLAQVRRHLARVDVSALLLCDPNDIFYATGAMNMQIFSARTVARALLVVAEGPTVLFEYRGCEHLAEELPTIDRIEIAEGFDIVSSGDDVAGASARFAAAIVEILGENALGPDRIAIDRFPFICVDALRSVGFTTVSSDVVMTPARMLKLPIELGYLRHALAVVDRAVEQVEQAIEPGRTEAEVWAHFHFELMAGNGHHTVTRLFQSGPNTFPYFQECSSRVLEAGDLVCLDTDANAYENYSVDFSRTFLCGTGKPTVAQRTLYGAAREQLDHNASLLAPGMSFEELARRAWPVPDEYQQSRYYCIGHGLGMAGEWPNIPHAESDVEYGLSGVIEPGMILCLESYVGSSIAGEGVKLEDQFLVLDDGVETMSNYHFDNRLGG